MLCVIEEVEENSYLNYYIIYWTHIKMDVVVRTGWIKKRIPILWNALFLITTCRHPLTSIWSFYRICPKIGTCTSVYKTLQWHSKSKIMSQIDTTFVKAFYEINHDRIGYIYYVHYIYLQCSKGSWKKEIGDQVASWTHCASRGLFMMLHCIKWVFFNILYLYNTVIVQTMVRSVTPKNRII